LDPWEWKRVSMSPEHRKKAKDMIVNIGLDELRSSGLGEWYSCLHVVRGRETGLTSLISCRRGGTQDVSCCRVRAVCLGVRSFQ
jgi:hypothetical protein